MHPIESIIMCEWQRKQLELLIHKVQLLKIIGHIRIDDVCLLRTNLQVESHAQTAI